MNSKEKSNVTNAKVTVIFQWIVPLRNCIQSRLCKQKLGTISTFDELTSSDEEKNNVVALLSHTSLVPSSVVCLSSFISDSTSSSFLCMKTISNNSDESQGESNNKDLVEAY